MKRILIIGSDPEQTILSNLKRIFEKEFIRACTNEHSFENTACDIVIFMRQLTDKEIWRAQADIIIFSNAPPPTASIDFNIRHFIHDRTTIIINGDDLYYQKMLLDVPANIITYGLNYKSSITASSIEENMESKVVQLCIQRSFKTISGNEVSAQELAVSLPAADERTTLNQLAAIAGALSYGVNRKTILLAY